MEALSAGIERQDSAFAQDQMPGIDSKSGGLIAWITALWSKETEMVLLIATLIVLLLVLTISPIAKARHGKQANQRRLPAGERERILSQLKTWINGDELTPQGEGKRS
jgi:hypothetical protein